jgi:hypothetical protein
MKCFLTSMLQRIAATLCCPVRCCESGHVFHAQPCSPVVVAELGRSRSSRNLIPIPTRVEIHPFFGTAFPVLSNVTREESETKWLHPGEIARQAVHQRNCFWYSAFFARFPDGVESAEIPPADHRHPFGV